MSARIYTIGYEGAELGEFIATLRAHGIKQVIDIRELPLSRRKGFSKNQLKDALECNGIEYAHLKALGDPKPGREAARRGDFAEFRLIFKRHMATSIAASALLSVAGIAEVQASCLMCFERDYENCHRAIVAEKLRHASSFEVTHLTVAAKQRNKDSSIHDNRNGRELSLG